MARRPRVHAPGGFYHVTLRGNHREPIFFTSADRDFLDSVVGEATTRLGARIHAYCWMTNHVHLLVQVSEAPLGRLILRIASRYARGVQARLATSGHLFERRHHAVLIDADSHLLAVVRYIHRNPLRAGMVATLADYPWSSHHAHLGNGGPAWLSTAVTRELLGGGLVESILRYRDFMAAGADCRWGEGPLAPRPDQPGILGGDDFVARVTAGSPKPCRRVLFEDLLRECAMRFQVTQAALASPSRSRHLAAARAWLGHEAVSQGVTSVSEVARQLCRSEAALRQVMANHPPATRPGTGTSIPSTRHRKDNDCLGRET